MDLPAPLDIIHQPQRLRIMGLLWKRGDISYVVLRDALGLTDGNLANHARRLEDAGLLASRRALAGDHFEVRYRITRDGRDAFRAYLEVLRGFLDAADPEP